ncbi:hypothetical protein TELCIR_16221 [Teladorsagia circumcincta]|uniref:Uncharacterized protein n=1 Tax=Teladorsagia circumcincta TaxID=45464 RepID=A0A2G9TYB6_TELCI|nr:hypothetical protein TELCIR_16221 [Teladorsagia circumcincta]
MKKKGHLTHALRRSFRTTTLHFHLLLRVFKEVLLSNYLMLSFPEK